MVQRKSNKLADKGVVVNQLVIKTLNRQSQDIEKWRIALRSADNNRRTLLYYLYEDILLDPILKNAINKRIRPITNAGVVFTSADNKEIPEITALINSKAGRRLLREIIQAKMWGITVVELSFSDEMRVFNIPRTHIRPDKHIVTINENDETGINYDEDPFLIGIDGEEKFGEILQACPYVIYKRGNFGDWAQFAELFGMPFRIAKYDAYDNETRVLLTQAMEEAGSAAYAVIPKGGDIEYVDNKTTGGGELYDNLRKACNEEILIGILGQTMTSVQGDKGARSLGEVHLEVEQGIHADDRIFAETVLNGKFLKWLESRGFAVAGGKFGFPEMGETLTLTDRLNIDTKLNEIVEIEADYFYETYGVPKPASGGGKKAKETPETEPPEPKPTAKKIKLNDSAITQKGFWKGLADFFVAAPQAGALKTGNLLTNDDDFLKRFYDNQPDFDIGLFNHTASTLISNLRKGWNVQTGHALSLADVGFDYGYINEVAQTAMEINLFHFSAAKTLAECQELNKLFRESKGFGDFLKKAQPKHDIFNKTWAQTEYDTAYLTAESSATYYRLKEQTDLFPFWCFLTQADGKVRPTHVPLHGIVLPANDPRWGKLYPPIDWNDRCYVVPRTRSEAAKSSMKLDREKADLYANSDEFKKAEKQGWGVNRAELKQVFTANQMYIRKFPGKSSKEIAGLTAPDYNLKSISTEMKSALNTVVKYEGDAQTWWNAQNKQVGDVILKDYNNRHVVLSSETFKAHTSAKGGSLTAYLDVLKTTLANPAEVWLSGKMLDEVVMLSFYLDEVIAVVCRIENGKVNTVSGYMPLVLTKAEVNRYRSGLLIKK